MSALTAVLDKTEAGFVLRAPMPGLWRDAPPAGALIREGSSLGALEVLGEVRPLVAPAGAFGVVGDLYADELARRPVDAATRLMTLDPEGIDGAAELLAAQDDGAEAGGPVFRTRLGGRFYSRPSPDEPAFVKPGDRLAGGETVALIEVMKTFNRVRYDGEPATVRSVAPADGDDVEAGAVLLVLEAEE